MPAQWLKNWDNARKERPAGIRLAGPPILCVLINDVTSFKKLRKLIESLTTGQVLKKFRNLIKGREGEQVF